MVVTLGEQYNIGEKPTVILYSYINRHAGTTGKHVSTQLQVITDAGQLRAFRGNFGIFRGSFGQKCCIFPPPKTLQLST